MHWYTKELHKKYGTAGCLLLDAYILANSLSTGPLVRIAPNEVSVSDPAAMKAIHAVNAGYTKVHPYASVVR
jgi:hypothetical protein